MEGRANPLMVFGVREYVKLYHERRRIGYSPSEASTYLICRANKVLGELERPPTRESKKRPPKRLENMVRRIFQ
ncbi:MAG: hypothetical protein NUV97_00130 [archaeon]|nr:hypothetical protein [archaeon]MCR4323586.1 hypothetical protein [Nanoarchaeota archaeon]